MGALCISLIAFVPWFGYFVVGLCCIVSLFYSRFYLYEDCNYSDLDTVGVSVVKPLMGTDLYLEDNLESYFLLNYPKIELLLCVEDANDPAVPVVKKLQNKYPRVESKLFIGGKDDVVNPMVSNMVPAYNAAKFNIIWVATSRVQASNAALRDMLGKLSDPQVALVHQMPFVAEQRGFASAVEKIYFGCTQARFYLTFNVLGFNCFTGMSYLIDKSELDKINGLEFYGQFLAEDYFFSKSLHSKGFRHRVSAYPAVQRISSLTISSHKQRMVRWLRLRMNMVPLVSAVLEPLAECLPLGLYMAWSMYYLFDLDPKLWFAGHVFVWYLMDIVQLSVIQRGHARLSLAHYTAAWLMKELLAVWIYVEALCSVRHIRWGARLYRLSMCGRKLQRVQHKPVISVV